VRGFGKTPKAYFLTRKGWELLSSESGVPPEVLVGYKEVKVEAAWSPQMYHRLATVDLLMSYCQELCMEGSRGVLFNT
jgi:hypothetical protein